MRSSDRRTTVQPGGLNWEDILISSTHESVRLYPSILSDAPDNFAILPHGNGFFSANSWLGESAVYISLCLSNPPNEYTPREYDRVLC